MDASGKGQGLLLGFLVLVLLGATACAGSTPPTSVPLAKSPTSDPTTIPTSTQSYVADTNDTPNASGQVSSPISSPQDSITPEITSTPSAAGTTETALLARAQEANEVWGNWLAYYKYTSPRFREVCKSGDYVTTTATAMLFLKSFMGIPEDARIETKLDKVEITGDSEGRVYTSLLIDGEMLEFSDNSGERWVYLESQWWEEPEDWQEGCPELDFTSESGAIKSEATEPPPLTSYGLQERIVVQAASMPHLVGEPELTGEVRVTFLGYESTGGIEDRFTGRSTIKAQGQFVIVYYSVTNDLNSKMQPGTQINEELYITDDRGRRWETVDYTRSYGGVSGSAALARGYEQPETWISPGFEGTTAAVFDVPVDTQNLALIWERAQVRISLD